MPKTADEILADLKVVKGWVEAAISALENKSGNPQSKPRAKDWQKLGHKKPGPKPKSKA